MMVSTGSINSIDRRELGLGLLPAFYGAGGGGEVDAQLDDGLAGG